jgi:MFS family permease
MPTRGGIEMLRAGTVVVGATLAGAVGLGTVTSHGVLVVHLDGTTTFGVGLGALLVAVSTALQFLLGPLAGRLTDRIGIRRVLVGATGAYVAGAVAAGTSARTASVVGYAVGTGIAGAATLTPLLATAAGWFRRGRAAALAVVSSGNAVGAVVIAPWLAASIDTRGLAATTRLLGAGGAVLLLLATAAVGSPRGEDATTTPAVWRVRDVLRDPFLRRLYLSGILAVGGVTTVLTYLTPYAISLGVPAARAAALLGLVSAAGIVGRLAVASVPGAVALTAYRAALLGVAACASLWLLAPAAPTLLTVFAVAFGVASGCWSALAPLVLAEVHAEWLASVLGAVYTSAAVGGAFGPVAASLLLRRAPLAAVGVLLGIALLAAHGVLRPPSRDRRQMRRPDDPAGRPPVAEEPACA